MEEGESLFERIGYKLVEKHIAGKTMSAAIAKALMMNEKDLLADLTFLSEVPDNRAKISYITNTYMQLARQMGRFGIRGAMTVPIDQLGSAISVDVACESIEKIQRTCRHYATFPWYQVGSNENDIKVALCLENKEDFGMAFCDSETLSKFMKKNKMRNVKLVVEAERDVKELLGEKSAKGAGRGEIASAMSKAKGVTIMCSNDEAMKKLAKASRQDGKYTFEFEFGDSEKRWERIARKGVQISIYMPFGKDWVRYAINKVPEGHIRSFASELIKQKEVE